MFRFTPILYFIFSIAIQAQKPITLPDSVVQQKLFDWYEKLGTGQSINPKGIAQIENTALAFRQKSTLLSGYDSHYIFNSLGKFYSDKSQYKKAEYWIGLTLDDLTKKAINPSEKENPACIYENLTDANNLMMTVKRIKTDYTQALFYGRQALKFSSKFAPYIKNDKKVSKANQMAVGRTLLNLAAIYNRQKQYDSAKVYAEKGATFLNVLVQKDRYEFNSGQGLLYSQASNFRDFNKSISFINTAYNLSKTPEQKLRALQRKTQIYLLSNQLDKAQVTIDEAKLIETKGISDFIKNQTYIIQGDILRLKGALSEALVSYQKAVDVHKTDLFSDNLRASLYGKYQVLLLQKKYKEAVVVASQIDDNIDVLRNNYESDDSKLFLIDNQYSFYESALEACYIQHDTAAAFRFIEKSRAVLLMEHLSYQEREKAKPIVSNVQAIKDSLQRHHQTLLSYFVGDSAVYAYSIANGQTKFLKLDISPQALEKLTTDFYMACTQKQYKWYEQLWATVRGWFGDYNYFHEAYLIYEALFEPLDLQPNSNVLVSFDGQAIPFEAFLKADTLDSKYFLLNDFNFNYTYSTSFWAQSLDKVKENSQSLLAVVPVTFNDLPTLSGGDEVAASLRKLNYTVTELREKQASKATVLSEIQKNYGTIYFHTHAQANPANGQADLFLFESDTLQMAELMKDGVQIKANLVVLTACQTAVGTAARGEGVMSLARGFAYSGVPSTIASTWSIPEAASTEIAQDFFENLQQKQSRNVALASSKRAFIKNQPDKTMPIFWAGLVLIGD